MASFLHGRRHAKRDDHVGSLDLKSALASPQLAGVYTTALRRCHRFFRVERHLEGDFNRSGTEMEEAQDSHITLDALGDLLLLVGEGEHLVTFRVATKAMCLASPV